MCRIAGYIAAQLPYNIEELIISMRDAMQHGGPDDEGLYINKKLGVALGHRRLALIDFSPSGHQPMFYQNRKIGIVFNGEIYNFQSLKTQLNSLGYAFSTQSDTEVILAAYVAWGTAAFDKLNGMFAFALLDEEQEKIFLVRDHAGIKPLYYAQVNQSILFSSEIKAFKKVNPHWEEHSNWKKYFLLFGHLPEPITTLEMVKPLPRGHYLSINLKNFETELKVFKRFYYNYTITDREEAITKVRETLQETVKRHLISDAPIGLFLSGGIDSSLLTLLSKPHVGNHLQTLSIVFEDEKFSEKKYQDLIIKKTGAHHQSFLITEEEFQHATSDIIASMDQPSNDGINSYFICKYAKAYGLKAVLSGLGADELFGGYPSFQRNALLSTLKKMPSFLFSLAGIFPDDKKKRIQFLQYKSRIKDYLYNRGFFVPSQVAQILECSEEEVEQLLEEDLIPLYYTKLHPQEQTSFLENNLYMQNQLLKDTDYMSMWHSVEVRVPFLDKHLMELVYSIHPSVRYEAQLPKHLLIQAFHYELPKAIWDRPKQGFVFPFENWMKKIKPTQSNKQANYIHQQFLAGNLHWSRYWCFLQVSNMNNLSITHA